MHFLVQQEDQNSDWYLVAAIVSTASWASLPDIARSGSSSSSSSVGNDCSSVGPQEAAISSSERIWEVKTTFK